MKLGGATSAKSAALRLVPDHPKPFAVLEELLSSWIDERLRTVLDEKLREWLARSPPFNTMPTADRPEYLGRADAATLTGYSAKTISRWIRSRKLRAYGLRGERVKRSELERLMAELPSQAHHDAGIIEAEETVARRILESEQNRKGNR